MPKLAVKSAGRGLCLRERAVGGQLCLREEL